MVRWLLLVLSASLVHGGSPDLPVTIDHVADALRWTGEVNRQLFVGTSVTQPSRPEPLRGGESCYRIPKTLPPSQLTVFHAKSPRPSQHGSARWGPALPAYLQHLAGLLSVDSRLWSLAMVYLDRASSAETPRSNGCLSVPFVTPRTVHRLVLAAAIVAVQATSGKSLEQILPKLASLGMAEDQLRAMVEWMHSALGDPGWMVSPDQMEDFYHAWEATFWRDEQEEEEEQVVSYQTTRRQDIVAVGVRLPQ